MNPPRGKLKNIKTHVVYNCKTCGKEGTHPASRVQEYCSRECSRQAMRLNPPVMSKNQLPTKYNVTPIKKRKKPSEPTKVSTGMLLHIHSTIKRSLSSHNST